MPYADIRDVHHLGGNDVTRVNELLDQLSPSKKHRISAAEVNRTAINAHLIVAYKDGKVIGLTCLNVIPTLSYAYKALIDDVVVDQEHRGHKVAEAMMLYAISIARTKNCDVVELTSNPMRTAAHALYKKLGFTERYAGVFQLKLKH